MILPKDIFPTHWQEVTGGRSEVTQRGLARVRGETDWWDINIWIFSAWQCVREIMLKDESVRNNIEIEPCAFVLWVWVNRRWVGGQEKEREKETGNFYCFHIKIFVLLRLVNISCSVHSHRIQMEPWQLSLANNFMSDALRRLSIEQNQSHWNHCQ